MESKFQTWLKEFQTATDFDGWGQPLEASELYKKLSRQITAFINVNNAFIDDEQEESGISLANSLELRVLTLQSPKEDGISLMEIKSLRPALSQLINEVERKKSILQNSEDLARFRSRALSLDTGDADSGDENPTAKWLNDHQQYMEPEKSYLTVKIEKIGLKDAFVYKSPYILVTVKDSLGIELVPGQKTNCSTRIDGNWIYLDAVVHIQKALENMPVGFAVFFELKHYKMKKRYNSTKCFSFLEKNEIQNGSAVLELYKKPTDYRRRNLQLLTTKPLYLHLEMRITKG